MGSDRSEVDIVVERPSVWQNGRTENSPLVEAVSGRDFFKRPAKIRQKEGRRPRNPRQLVVIQEHDACWADQTFEVGQVHEHSVEAVIAIDEGKVEAASLTQKLRQDGLRFL